jgi:hypothetical protein
MDVCKEIFLDLVLYYFFADINLGDLEKKSKMKSPKKCIVNHLGFFYTLNDITIRPFLKCPRTKLNARQNVGKCCICFFDNPRCAGMVAEFEVTGKTFKQLANFLGLFDLYLCI